MRHPTQHISKWLRTVIFLLLFGIIFGLALTAIFNWYSTTPKSFVFNVPPKMTDYFLRVNDIEMLKYRLKNGELTQQQFDKQFATLKRQIDKTSTTVKKVLKQSVDHYGDALKQPVNNFIKWQESFNIDRLVNFSKKEKLSWHEQYRSHKKHLYTLLRNLSGIYEINDRELAHIMELVPTAKTNLAKHPNDYKLCTTLQHTPKRMSAKKTAEQIAFTEWGHQYCDHYYNKTSSWPTKLTKNIAPQQTSNEKSDKLNSLPYPIYYKQYILPRIPKALTQFKDRENNQFLCRNKGLSNWHWRRNPEKDAVREAYKQGGKQFCVDETKVEDKNYSTTAYSCINMVTEEFGCGYGTGCDVIERCKPIPGVLFKQTQN